MNTIECPKCGEIIEIETILEDQTKEKLKSEIEEKYKKPYLEQLKENRELKEKMSDFDVELEKKLTKEIEKTRADAKNKSDQEYQLKLAEERKIKEDLLKQLEEARRTGQQGSQQTQGEVLELELEQLLKQEFPSDQIEPVAKGVRGADVVQKVIDKKGNYCGTILWEAKNAKWNQNWISKLKDNQRQENANLSVLVAVDLPPQFQQKKFGPIENDIWVTDRQSSIGLASALRMSLIHVNYAKAVFSGKNEKKDILYDYISSNEFIRRIELISGYYLQRKNEIEKEKGQHIANWAREEKQLTQVCEETEHLYGSLQGIIGQQKLPELKTLQIEAENENVE